MNNFGAQANWGAQQNFGASQAWGGLQNFTAQGGGGGILTDPSGNALLAETGTAILPG